MPSPSEVLALLYQMKAQQGVQLATEGEQRYLNEHGDRVPPPSHGRAGQGHAVELSPAMREDRDNRLALAGALNGFGPNDLDGLTEAEKRTIGHLTLAQRARLDKMDELEARGLTVIPVTGFTQYRGMGDDQVSLISPSAEDVQVQGRGTYDAPGPDTSQTVLQALQRIRAVFPRSFSSSAV